MKHHSFIVKFLKTMLLLPLYLFDVYEEKQNQNIEMVKKNKNFKKKIVNTNTKLLKSINKVVKKKKKFIHR
jgi:hypothetical protein